MIRGIYPTRFGQLHLRSHEGKGVPLVLLHMSPRSGAMWEELQERLDRPTHAPDRLGYGSSDAPPWALSLEQYAQATIEGLKAAGMAGPIDLLGMHTGSIEAIEIAQQLGSQVRRLAVVGMPLFTAEEQQRQLEKYSEQPLRPLTDGGHVLGQSQDAAQPRRRGSPSPQLIPYLSAGRIRTRQQRPRQVGNRLALPVGPP